MNQHAIPRRSSQRFAVLDWIKEHAELVYTVLTGAVVTPIVGLVRSVRKNSARITVIETKITTIEKTLGEIQEALEEHQRDERIHIDRTYDKEIREQISRNVKEVQEQVLNLTRRIDDLSKLLIELARNR